MGFITNPMGFAWVFSGVFFSKIKSHGVGTCKIKYLKTISKCFIFFIHLFRIQHPLFGTKLWFRQYVWKGVHNAAKMSIPKLSVQLFKYLVSNVDIK